MVKRLDKLAVFCLYSYAIFAPHSIFLSEASIILGLVFSLINMIALRKSEGRWSYARGSLERPILAFCAISVFSFLTAYDHFRAVRHIKSLWLVIFYFLVINTVKERRLVIRLITVLIISSFFASIYGLFQYFFMHTIAVQAFIKNVITLAGLFLLIVPFSLALIFGEERRGKRLVYLLISVAILAGLIFTMERSVWVGLAVVILTFLFMERRSMGAAALGIIIFAILFSIFTPLRDRIKAIGHLDTYAVSSRFHQWQSGLEMMFDHPLTGVGPGNYEAIYKQYKFFEERKTYTHAHSNIVQIGAETGILGLGIFFWVMVSAFRGIWSRLRQAREPLAFAFSLAALAAFLGFNFAGLFEHNFGDSEVQLLFWFIVGSAERL